MENKDLLAAFTLYLMLERGYSEKTKEAYQRDIYDFEVLTKSSEVDSILRQPLFVFARDCLSVMKNIVTFVAGS